jgi:Concanavalin A-like lectin/glucanases superfamily
VSRGTFTGTQRLGIAVPPIGITTFTVHCWVHLPGSQSANNRIWQLGNSIGLGFQLAGTKIQIVDEIIAWRGAGVTPALNTWFTICLTRNGGPYSLYHEGVLVETPASATPQALSGGFAFGNSNDATHSLFGYGALLAMWSAALSANEILSLKRGQSPLTIQPASFQGMWPGFGLGAGADEPDLSIRQRLFSQNNTNLPVVAGNPGIPPPVPTFPL